MEAVVGPGHVLVLAIGEKKIEAELALDEPSRAQGLMFRKELPPDRGMLFVWPEHLERRGVESGLEKRSFWMRNTSIPLSIAYIDEDGKILQIEDMRPYDERKVLSKDEVRFALEMNQGWFQKNGIGPGAIFQDFRNKVGRLEAR